jgi:excinuclease ABC subunit B
VNGEVYLFADIITKSMEALMNITEYRRARQIAYNEKHGITPQSVRRAVQESLHTILKGKSLEASVVQQSGGSFSLTETLRELHEEMLAASAALEFEKAALLRDQIQELKASAGITKLEPAKRPENQKRKRGGFGSKKKTPSWQRKES